LSIPEKIGPKRPQSGQRIALLLSTTGGCMLFQRTFALSHKDGKTALLEHLNLLVMPCTVFAEVSIAIVAGADNWY
jgi:hypothetical protein